MKPCGHTHEEDGCRVCWLHANDPAYRDLFDSNEWRPCRHRGDVLTDEEKADRDLVLLRVHHFCHHPRQPLGEAPCECQGCGRACPWYQSPA